MSTTPSNEEQRVAIVTGGSRGIGRGIVERLCGSGLFVCFTYLSNEQAAQSLIDAQEKQGHALRALKVDSRDASALSALVEKVVEERGRLDVLVNNAGITANKFLSMMTDEEWASVLDTSLNGLFGASRPGARQMMRQRSGRIVNLTSVSGVVGFPGQTNYCAGKSAIIGFTRALAKELAQWGVSVNAVAPGYVDTEMLDVLTAAQRKAATDNVPMKRFGTVDEVAELVRYVALEAPPYLTGQTLVLDGGLTA